MAGKFSYDHHGNRCVSISRAAKMKGVSKEAIRQAIKRGVITVTGVTENQYLIPLSALREYTPSPSHMKPLPTPERAAS